MRRAFVGGGVLAALAIGRLVLGAAAAPATDGPAAGLPLPAVHDVALFTEGGATTVRVRISGPARYRVTTLDRPFRVVVDFLAARYEWRNAPLTVDAGPVRAIRGSQWRDRVARVVVELGARTRYRLEATAEGLDIVFEPAPGPAPPVPASPGAGSAPVPTRPGSTPEASPPSPRAAAPAPTTPPRPGPVPEATAPPAGGPAEGPLVVRVSRDLLTVRASGVPLRQVLAAISRQAGVRILMDQPGEEPVTVALSGVPLDEGLRRLIGPRDFAFVYSGASPPRLAEIRVYSRAGTDGAARSSGDVWPPGASEPGAAARQRTIIALQSQGAGAVESLAQMLQDDESEAVREAAARALARTRTEIAIPPLARALREDARQQVRVAAAEALGALGSERAVPALVGALRDGEPAVRVTAVEALGAIGGRQAVVALLEAAAGDRDPQVRQAAAEAVRRLGTPR
jgi:hypothetical protein